MDQIVIGDNFKYLVINTGYTSRLLDDVDDIETEIKNRLDYMCDSTEQWKDSILYIYDKIWGLGYYACNGTKKEQNHVRDTIGEKYESGVIAIKCNNISSAFCIINILMKKNYCGCFNMEFLMAMILIDDVLIVEFDCESG